MVHTRMFGSDSIDRNGKELAVNFKYLERDPLLERLKNKTDKLHKLETKCTLLDFENSRLKLLKRTLKDELKDLAKDGAMGEVACSVIKTIRKGDIKGKEESALNVMKVIAKNLPRNKKGHRYTSVDDTDYSDIFQGILMLGGSRVLEFVAGNLDGPNVDTVKNWMTKGSFVYDLANFYKMYKEKLSEEGAVPYLIAEDETAIKQCASYDQRLDSVWGFYGADDDNHKCSNTYLIRIGDGENAYKNLIEAMKRSRIASYARVLMINPLHERLPRSVLHLQPTYNCFTANDVEEQWSFYDYLCWKLLIVYLDLSWVKDQTVICIVGSMLKQSSDEDSGKRFKPVPIDKGFLFSAAESSISGGRIVNCLSDQDNQLDYTPRNYIRLVAEVFNC